MNKRLVEETLCEHGYTGQCNVAFAPCPGGSRRVLAPGEYVLVEKAEDGEWKDEDAETLLKWATQRLMRYESHSGGRYRHLEDCAEDIDFMMGALDALAEGEQ